MELCGRGAILAASRCRRRNVNIQGLSALELRTNKPDSTPWDFNTSAERRLAKAMVVEQEPAWLAGSPPCTPCCLLNANCNYSELPTHVVEEQLREVVRHHHFMVSVDMLQLRAGRKCLHEHPESAARWHDSWMKRRIQQPGVHVVVSDQCEYWPISRNHCGECVRAKKPTQWAASSTHMARRLSTLCSKDHIHEHVLRGGGAAGAAFFTIFPSQRKSSVACVTTMAPPTVSHRSLQKKNIQIVLVLAPTPFPAA